MTSYDVCLWLDSLSFCFLFPFTNLFLLLNDWGNRESRLLLYLFPKILGVTTWLSHKSLKAVHPPGPGGLSINPSRHDKVLVMYLEHWWAPGSSPGGHLVFVNSHFFIIRLTRLYAYDLEVSGCRHPNRKEPLKFNQSSKLVGKVPSLPEPRVWKPKLSTGVHCQPQPCGGADRLWSLLWSFY